jgi:molybdenum cofactor guanylyltransferase
MTPEMSAETSPTPAVGAILLAGGRASRVGGAAKPLFEVAGTTLLQRAVDAVDGCSPVTVVGDQVDGLDGGITWVREDPPFGGPVAAVVAALRSWTGTPGGPEASPAPAAPGWTYLLACDMPGVSEAVARLAAALPHATLAADGLCLAATGSTRPQWLAGVYRTSALLRAAQEVPDEGHGASVRALLTGLTVEVVPAPADETFDVDTWEDLASARQRAAEQTSDHVGAGALATITSTSTSTSTSTTTLDGGTP